jgi:hypothetical protein
MPRPITTLVPTESKYSGLILIQDDPISHRQVLHHYHVQQREYRGIRPDADREHENGGECEAGPLPERARGVPQVLPEIAEQSAARSSRHDF